MRRHKTSILAIIAIVATMVIGPASSVSAANCSGHQGASHTSAVGVWWTPAPKHASDRRIVNFWTNWPNQDQHQFKVKIGANHANLQLGGGGTPWYFTGSQASVCWNDGYAKNPLPSHTLKWMLRHGLARYR